MLSSSQQVPEFPFCGRERELETLEGFLDDAARGRGNLVFISGEAGVGKTRLAQEFMKMADSRGASSLYARAESGSSSLPYSLWVECVRQFASETPALSFFEICGDAAEPILRLLPEMAALAGRKSPSGATSERQQQSVLELLGVSPVRYFEALTQFVLRLSKRGTLSIVLDDFQWCDQSSLDLLQYIESNGLADHPLLILCLYRDTDETGVHAVNRTMQRLTSARVGGGREENTTIRLERLDLATTARLLKSSSKSAIQPSDEFCELMHRKTGGNPLFIKETLALLAQHGALPRESRDQFIPSKNFEIQVPNSVKDVVKKRLMTVNAEVVETLRAAALIGQTFQFGVLREIAPAKNDEHLDLILQAAAASGLIQEAEAKEGGRVYTFADEAIVEVLIETFDPESLRRYSLQIAEIKEERLGEKRDERAAELADHFRRGGSPKKAFEYSLKAGDAASRVNAFKEARLHYERALASLEQLKDQGWKLARGTVLEKLGDMLWVEAETGSAYVHWEESASTYEALGESERAGHLRRKMGHYYSVALLEPEKAMEQFKLALQDFSKIPKGPGLAALYHHVGHHYWWMGRYELARENWERAIEIARESEVFDVNVITSVMLAFVTPINEKEKILDLVRKSELITLDRILPLGYDTALFYDAAIWWAKYHAGLAMGRLTGNPTIAQEYMSQALEAAERLGGKSYMVWVRVGLAGFVYFPRGELAIARKLLADVLSWPLLERPSLRAAVLCYIGQISLLEGDLEKAENELKAAYESSSRTRSSDTGNLTWRRVRLLLGSLYSLEGDYRQAERYLGEAHKTLRGPNSRLLQVALHYPLSLFLLIQLCIRKGNRDEAASHLDQLRDYAAFAHTDLAAAYSSWAAGLVAIFDENWAEAISALEEAVRCWRRQGWHYELGGACRSLALARLENGEVEVASTLLDEALDIFSTMGAKRDVQETVVAKAAVKEQGASRVYKLTREGSDTSKKVFEYLVRAFVGDYVTKKLPPDSSGWRSLVQVARGTRIPYARFYRRTGKNDGGLQELLRIGLAEQRDFPHQRGRGGIATRARIAYEDEDVKKYVARRSKGKSLVLARESID